MIKKTMTRQTLREKVVVGVLIIGMVCLFLLTVSYIYTQTNFIRPIRRVEYNNVAPLKNNFIRPKLNQSFLDAEYKNAVSRDCPFPQLSKFYQPLTDFETFPCLGQLTPSEQLKQNGHCVRTVNFPKEMLTDKTGCAVLKSGRGTPICTYTSTRDQHVSASINKHGVWENGFVQWMLDILKKNPGMALLDVGCNIGVYTLAAASQTHTVVSIDASLDNLFLVSSSLTHGNLWENVTLVWNAISKAHEVVVLRKQAFLKNIGGAEIDTKSNKTTGCDAVVNTIILDDIKDLLVGKKVYMKLDIEGQEANLLQHGEEFLKTVNVRYVQLEYNKHKGKPGGKTIIDRMAAHGFLPFSDCRGIKPLKPSEEARWPFDMCFIRQNIS